jgi:hypothetical protein
MSAITWSDSLAAAKARAADEGRLLLTYIYSPG